MCIYKLVELIKNWLNKMKRHLFMKLYFNKVCWLGWNSERMTSYSQQYKSR